MAVFVKAVDLGSFAAAASALDLSAPMVGMMHLLMIAGIDTTWNAIGAALWHLAENPDDARRLCAEPDLIPTAIEELLRAYSPVTPAREVMKDGDVGGCPVKGGEMLFLSFPAANRDPAKFADADKVLIDRKENPSCRFRARHSSLRWRESGADGNDSSHRRVAEANPCLQAGYVKAREVVGRNSARTTDVTNDLRQGAVGFHLADGLQKSVLFGDLELDQSNETRRSEPRSFYSK
jgi:hypothetical protein